MAKLKCAWFDFTSCEGCQVELTNFGEPFFELLNFIEPVEFREVMSEKTTEQIDISFIEGSFTREEDRKRLEDIRARSNVVVAYGACAVTGGINALKNHMDDYKDCVYGKDKDMPHLDSQLAKPISAAIKVDYEVAGCPMNRDEFVQIVSQIVHGTARVYTPSYPVCVECKLRETLCRYDDGDHCLGMVARAGCGAPCPADGIPCEACRGMVKDANQDSLVETLESKGKLSRQRAESKSRMFTANFRGDAK
ncbi:hypothetical protein AUK40_00965 [Candidatus Wirthbacteria bacterium CG2_30_54_11]|uniref:NADH:ubiquinone oxidoreductase-like 20kDa subunit domain-containing protein n=1 Tax=Candidatus Wirthbacteria bacterium CG2_30_54_11 TaxID=1817892 RepID=A0A1J5IP95_9BACT|nr:MAG: hypothetical protein AUK40_00965 [Candidatus Wirthbacteria bacterium CG2_30_54_11]